MALERRSQPIKWPDRHKKARRGASPRYRDFIGKPVERIKTTCAAGAALGSVRERARNDQPAANQQGEGDTAESGENAVAAIDRLSVGGRSLRREQSHPEVTHAFTLR